MWASQGCITEEVSSSRSWQFRLAILCHVGFLEASKYPTTSISSYVVFRHSTHSENKKAGDNSVARQHTHVPRFPWELWKVLIITSYQLGKLLVQVTEYPQTSKSFSTRARILWMYQFSFVIDIFSSSLARGIPAEAHCVIAVSLS